MATRPGAGVEAEPTTPRPPVAGKRRQAREMAVQMLYQEDLGGSSEAQIFGSFDLPSYRRETAEVPGDNAPDPWDRVKGEEAFAYAKRLVSGTLAHREQIDRWLRDQAEHWRLERMPAVDRNILRLAIFELAFEPDVPKVVVIDEAIELAKKFGSEQSSSFVNGLLDALIKEQEFPGSMT